MNIFTIIHYVEFGLAYKYIFKKKNSFINLISFI